MSGKEKFWEEWKEGIKNWSDVKEFEKELLSHQQTSKKTKKWIFRAERFIEKLEKEYFQENVDATSCCTQKENENKEYFETHLEKAFRLYGVKDEDKKESERKLIRKFQRKAALYLEREPDKDDILEWLAIMRHHGAPTRLSDWTYSFYIAVYFALAEEKDGILWVLNTPPKIRTPEPIKKKIKEKDCHKEYERFEKYFQEKADILGIRKEGDKLVDLAIASYLIEHPFPYVYPVNPFRLNKRLSVQQGLFLMPGDITKSFVKNLTATFGGFEETKKYLWRVKIVPRTEDRNEILERLRDMNMSNEVLFPGLDGFAKSVGEGLAYPRKLGNT